MPQLLIKQAVEKSIFKNTMIQKPNTVKLAILLIAGLFNVSAIGASAEVPKSPTNTPTITTANP